MFCVVIPFYQREAGVLARALRSIAAQDADFRINVYVVDDSSPVPAGAEATAAGFDPHRLTIIRQPNAGPGAARNRGIDAALAAGADAIAFLDSDDEWEPHHCRSARDALRAGFDVYTADLVPKDSAVTSFARYLAHRLSTVSAGSEPWQRALAADVIDYTVDAPLFHCSTAVATASAIGDVRFDPALRNAGEDALFWCRVAARRPRVFVALRVDTRMGHGVNIFTAGAWNSLQAVRRLADYHRSRVLLAPYAAGSAEATRRLRIATIKARVALWRVLLSRASRGRFHPRTLSAMLISDPRAAFAWTRLLRGRQPAGVTPRSWTSKVMSVLGGITPPAPRSP